MPIYEYFCLDCDLRFEDLRSFSEADEPIFCDECHSKNTQRAVTAAYAHSGGRVLAGSSSSIGCGGCSGGACSTCGV